MEKFYNMWSGRSEPLLANSIKKPILIAGGLLTRTLVKSVYRKTNFLISQPKHMLKLMGNKLFTILRSKIVFA